MWFRQLIVVSLASTLAAAVVVRTQSPAGGGWGHYGGDKAYTRYSPLEQINKPTTSRR